MNQQPTVILLKFTDFLNNLDSLAFLRLSRSFWFSHRTPSGRYRLKPKLLDSDPPDVFISGPILSSVPLSFFSCPLKVVDEFSPVGNFLLDSINLAGPQDFHRFNQLFSSREEFHHRENNLPGPSGVYFLDVLKNVLLDYRVVSESPDFPGLRGLPRSLESLQMRKPIPMHKLFPSLQEDDEINSKLKILLLGSMAIEGGGPGCLDFFFHPLMRENLETLQLPFNCDVLLEPGYLPNSLKELSLGHFFSSPLLPSVLPDSLEILRFYHRSWFDHPINTIPSSLRELVFGEDFDQKILPGHLPAGLKIIKFGLAFNQQIDSGVFPPGVEEISFESLFVKPLSAGILPCSLKRFSCHLRDSSFSSSLLLPESLEILDLHMKYTFSGPLPKFPTALKILRLVGGFEISPIDYFPPQLQILQLDAYNFPLKPGIFPYTLEEIILPSFNQKLEKGIFPRGLKKISFGAYNQPLSVGIFPDGIRSIDLGRCYQHDLAIGLFPSSVRKLQVITNAPILPGVFPEGVESIDLDPCDHTLIPGIFPSSLRRLSFVDFGWSSSGFQAAILPGLLPPFLYELNIGKYYGFFPFDSLPAYFRPDDSSQKSLCRLPPARPPSLYDKTVDRLYSAVGAGEFSIVPLRAPISSSGEYFCISRSSEGSQKAKAFIVNNSLINGK